MKIIQPTVTNKKQVLTLLDEFRNLAYKLDGINNNLNSCSARENWGEVYDYVMNADNHAMFVAIDSWIVVWIIIVHILPKVRSWAFFAEIETMYTKEAYRWTGLWKQLLDKSIEYLKNCDKNIQSIRLCSGAKLSRAHAFYEKYWFNHFGKAYQMWI